MDPRLCLPPKQCSALFHWPTVRSLCAPLGPKTAAFFCARRSHSAFLGDGSLIFIRSSHRQAGKCRSHLHFIQEKIRGLSIRHVWQALIQHSGSDLSKLGLIKEGGLCEIISRLTSNDALQNWMCQDASAVGEKGQKRPPANWWASESLKCDHASLKETTLQVSILIFHYPCWDGQWKVCLWLGTKPHDLFWKAWHLYSLKPDYAWQCRASCSTVAHAGGFQGRNKPKCHFDKTFNGLVVQNILIIRDENNNTRNHPFLLYTQTRCHATEVSVMACLHLTTSHWVIFPRDTPREINPEHIYRQKLHFSKKVPFQNSIKITILKDT